MYSYLQHFKLPSHIEPFTYSLFDPVTKDFTKITLGPELHKGHKLQVCVRGGLWKCGEMEDITDDDNDYDYALLGEAVAPGFDFHDFTWIRRLMELQL